MPNILLIEDNPGDARLIRELLKEIDTVATSYNVTHVERVSDAVALLSKPHAIDIILSDITLPDSRGMETLESLSKSAAELPVLFMTGTNDEALAVEALHQGAQDYLVKGRTGSEVLARSMQYAVERKRSQNEMNRIAAEAEASKQRIKLLASQKQQLIELNQAKDEFVSIASHQLRTPATAVKQYLGMILQGFVGDVDEQQLTLLQTAYESNDRQLIVINQLLKTAQIDSLKIVLKKQKTDIVALIEAVVKSQRPIIDMRAQTISFNCDEPHNIRIDAGEIRLVIENIIENASKYTPTGKNITVSIRQDEAMLYIDVADEGVGITAENQKRIFEKFTRIDNDLSDTVTGTGLGLYWAKKILLLHDGNLTVSSRLGKGSTFTIGLPK